MNYTRDDKEKNEFDKAREEFKKRYPRDYYEELKKMKLSDNQCKSVLEWINTLSIEITGNNHTVIIEDGIIKVSNTNE